MAIPSFPKVIDNGLPKAGSVIPNPARPLTEGIKTNTLVLSFDSGHEQRRQKSAPRRTFDLSWPVLTQGAYITLRNFYLKVLNITPFYWVHPVEKTTYLVRFSSDTFTGTNKSHNSNGPLYELALKLEQVWE